MLRALRTQFTELTHDMASVINVETYAQAQNLRLGREALDVTWLTGDEIVSLAKMDNPDNTDTEPEWLSGPGPLNYFYTFFAQTLAEPQHRGRIRIMVVNTTPDDGMAPAVVGGAHWFVVAWYIDP